MAPSLDFIGQQRTIARRCFTRNTRWRLVTGGVGEISFALQPASNKRQLTNQWFSSPSIRWVSRPSMPACLLHRGGQFPASGPRYGGVAISRGLFSWGSTMVYPSKGQAGYYTTYIGRDRKPYSGGHGRNRV